MWEAETAGGVRFSRALALRLSGLDLSRIQTSESDPEAIPSAPSALLEGTSRGARARECEV